MATKSSSHLHMALSTATGQVLGGHVAAGCTVRTTAEVLLALLPEWELPASRTQLRGLTSWWCGLRQALRLGREPGQEYEKQLK